MISFFLDIGMIRLVSRHSHAYVWTKEKDDTYTCRYISYQMCGGFDVNMQTHTCCKLSGRVDMYTAS